ncbi:MAG: DUF2937 family protein [Parachlamydiales bacterium]
MIIRFVIGILDRLFAVAGVIIFTQIPVFYQQYVQRLSGHLSELELQVSVLRKTASRSGKTLEAYITKFIRDPDADFNAQGQFMDNMVNRLVDLKQSFTAMVEAPIWSHPLYLFRYADSDIAWTTFGSFEPGLSFSIESLGYAFVGLIFGLGVFKLIRWAFLSILRFGRNKYGTVKTAQS